MLELPFNRSGLWKNASLDVTLFFDLPSSIVGRFGDEGKRFSALCMNPIDTMAFVARWGQARIGGELLPRDRQSVQDSRKN